MSKELGRKHEQRNRHMMRHVDRKTERVERSLDRIGMFFYDQVSQESNQRKVKQGSLKIERGQWDEHNIAVTWEGVDNVMRRIRASIENRSNRTIYLRDAEIPVTIDAWYYEENKEGVMEKHSRLAEIAFLNYPSNNARLQRATQEAHKRVTQWSKGDLTVITELKKD